MATEEQLKSQKKYTNGIVFLILGLVIGVIASRHYWTVSGERRGRGTEYRTGSQGLTNPLLDCEIATKASVQEFTSLESKIDTAIASEIAQKKASHVSVYFRGMNSGRWVGINEDEKYIGASLIKLPIAFAYYDWAEVKPEILTTKLVNDVDPQSITTQNIPAQQEIVKGESYSITDLLGRMLLYSDNGALTLLTRNIEQKRIENVFTNLGLSAEYDEQNNVLVSPKVYSTFFRVLHNATYFSQPVSEHVLQLLTQTEFTDGLVAGVPTGTRVAHKFGERVERDQDGNLLGAELHDCGIVYLPDHPFFLCIMTRGSDLARQKTVVQNITRAVYSYTDSYWKNGGK